MLDIAILQVVLRLNHGDWVQVVAVDNALGFLEAGRTPLFGNAVIQHLALGDQVAHRAQGLGKVGGLVKTVAKVHVQIIGLHVLQRLVDAFENVLAGQAAVVHAFAGGEVDLAGDDEFLTRVLLEHFAEESFGGAARVSVRAVEEVDAGIVGELHGLLGHVLGRCALEIRDPAAQRDLADLQSRLADAAILHVYSLMINRHRRLFMAGRER